MNIVKLKCADYTTDWVLDKEVEIDIDKYIFFEVEYRGENSWHLIGHQYNEETRKWQNVEFSYHVCTIYAMAKFIAKANAIPRNNLQVNRVSRFNNLHYSCSFYKELNKLLRLVQEYTLKIEKEGKNQC